MINTILLFKDDRGWNAWFKGPHAAETRRIFDSDVIPTAFATQAPAEVVRQKLQELNPDTVVEVI